MKRILSGLLICALCVGMLSGCQESMTHNSSTPSSSQTISKSSSTSEKSSSSAVESIDAPDYVVNIYSQFLKISEENSMGFSITSTPQKEINDGGYIFPINLGKRNFDHEVRFFRSDKTFKLQYSTRQADTSCIRDYITATFMATNSEMSIEDATSKMQELINSYSGQDFSQVIENGEYLIFIEPFSSDTNIIFAFHRDEIFDEINPDEYSPVDYASYSSPALNKGTYVYVEGTVTACSRVNAGYSITRNDFITIQATDGNEYRVSYSFKSHPVTFAVGEHHIFYGNIGTWFEDGEPLISLHYVQ